MRTIKNPAAQTPILTISPEKSEFHTLQVCHNLSNGFG